MKALKSIFVILGTILTLVHADAATSSKTPKVDVNELFKEPRVLEVKIEIPPASLESLKTDPHKYVRGIVREGSKVFNDAGIRLKGSGTFQSLEKKPSLIIKFNEFISGVRFHGHSKLVFDNARQDPSYVCEVIGGELFRFAGVPAPRSTFARVSLNGQDAGLYVLSEAVNKEFLAQYFSRTKGNLYEGSKSDVTDKLEKDSGDESKDQKDLQALAAAAKEPDSALRLKKLSSVLEIDRFVSFTATEVFAWHHDGYTMDQNNYRIYNDPGSNHMVFIPHGYDQLFGKPKGPLFPEWKGLVAKSLLATPEGKAKYRERMSVLLTTAFSPDTITKRIDQFAAAIRPVVTRDPATVQAFDAAIAQLKDRVAQRAAFVSEELKKK